MCTRSKCNKKKHTLSGYDCPGPALGESEAVACLGGHRTGKKQVVAIYLEAMPPFLTVIGEEKELEGDGCLKTHAGVRKPLQNRGNLRA